MVVLDKKYKTTNITSLDDESKSELKTSEFIKIDDVVFIRKDHAINIHKRCFENKPNFIQRYIDISKSKWFKNTYNNKNIE